LAALVFAAAACAGASGVDQASQPAARADAPEVLELDRATKLALEERMHTELYRMESAIYGYFASDQRVCSAASKSCAEPWHGATDDPDGSYVPSKDKVFPGGVNQTLVLTPKMPTGGELVALQPVASDHLEATLAALAGSDGSLPETSPFRYTYKTNGETGTQAEATLTAEADFNPDSPERHTIVVRFYVGGKWESARVERSEVQNPFE
jgi:hypothetical protein